MATVQPLRGFAHSHRTRAHIPPCPRWTIEQNLPQCRYVSTKVAGWIEHQRKEKEQRSYPSGSPSTLSEKQAHLPLIDDADPSQRSPTRIFQGKQRHHYRHKEPTRHHNIPAMMMESSPSTQLAKEVFRCAAENIKVAAVWSHHCSRAETYIEDFQAAEIVMLLYSLGRIKYYHPIIRSLCSRIQVSKEYLTPRGAAIVMNALRSLEVRDADTLSTLATHIVDFPRYATLHDLVLAANALSFFEMPQEGFWRKSAKLIPRDLSISGSPQHIALLINALGRLDMREQSLLVRLGECSLIHWQNFQPHQVCMALHGLVKLDWNHPKLSNAFLRASWRLIKRDLALPQKQQLQGRKTGVFDLHSLCCVLFDFACFLQAPAEFIEDCLRLLKGHIHRTDSRQDRNLFFTVTSLRYLHPMYIEKGLPPDLRQWLKEDLVNKHLLSLHKREHERIIDEECMGGRVHAGRGYGWTRRIFRVFNEMGIKILNNCSIHLTPFDDVTKGSADDDNTKTVIDESESNNAELFSGKDNPLTAIRLDFYLPEQRVAILCGGMYDYYSGTSQRTAMFKLKIRLLEGQGVRVAVLPYFEWEALTGEEQQKRYLWTFGRQVAADMLEPIHPSLDSIRGMQEEGQVGVSVEYENGNSLEQSFHSQMTSKSSRDCRPIRVRYYDDEGSGDDRAEEEADDEEKREWMHRRAQEAEVLGRLTPPSPPSSAGGDDSSSEQQSEYPHRGEHATMFTDTSKASGHFLSTRMRDSDALRATGSGDDIEEGENLSFKDLIAESLESGGVRNWDEVTKRIVRQRIAAVGEVDDTIGGRDVKDRAKEALESIQHQCDTLHGIKKEASAPSIAGRSLAEHLRVLRDEAQNRSPSRPDERIFISPTTAELERLARL